MMGKKAEKSRSITINPKIYPLDVIYSSAYVMLDKCYIFLEGDPENSINIVITAKNEKENLDKIISDFKDQLINYAFYKKQSEKNLDIRQLILNTAIENRKSLSDEEPDTGLADNFDNADFLDDPEGIAIPWEEKYGKSKKKEKTCKNEHKDKQRE